jgi:tetratricopeptide (TPR) repeat protein
MAQPRMFLTGLLCLLGIFWLCGCDEDSVPELVEKGKFSLQTADSDQAMAYFDQVLAKDSNNYDGLYGKLLATYMQLSDRLSIALELTKGVFVQEKDMPETDLSIMPMQLMVDGIVNTMIIPRTEEALKLTEKIKKQPEKSFLIAKYTITMMDRQLFKITGELDAGEAYFFEGLSHLLKGVALMLIAADSDFNPEVMDLTLPENPDLVDLLRLAEKNLNLILSDPQYPNFLNYRSDGSKQMQEAGQEIGRTMISWLDMIAEIKTETDPQDDPPIKDPRFVDDMNDIDPNAPDKTDIIRYVDKNKNNKFDSNEYFTTPRIKPFSPVGLEQLLTALSRSLNNHDAFDVASASRFLTDIFHLPYVVEIPAGCVTKDISAFFAGTTSFRTTVEALMPKLDQGIAMINQLQELIDSLLFSLKADAKYQLIWYKLATTLMETTPTNVDAKLASVLKLLEALNDVGQIVLSQENYAKLKHVLDIVSGLQDDLLNDAVAILNGTGELMLILMDVADAMPYPPATLKIADIKNMYLKFGPELRNVLIPMLPHITPILNEYYQEIGAALAKAEQDPEMISKIICVCQAITVNWL